MCNIKSISMFIVLLRDLRRSSTRTYRWDRKISKTRFAAPRLSTKRWLKTYPDSMLSESGIQFVSTKAWTTVLSVSASCEYHTSPLLWQVMNLMGTSPGEPRCTWSRKNSQYLHCSPSIGRWLPLWTLFCAALSLGKLPLDHIYVDWYQVPPPK